MSAQGQDVRVESCRLPVTRDGFPRRCPSLRNPSAFLSFSAGRLRLVGVWTLWQPVYGLRGGLRGGLHRGLHREIHDRKRAESRCQGLLDRRRIIQRHGGRRDLLLFVVQERGEAGMSDKAGLVNGSLPGSEKIPG